MTTAPFAALPGLEPGPTAALGAAMIWAFTSILFTAAGRNVVPVATNLFKTAAATLLFAVALLIRDGVPWDPGLDTRQLVLLGLSGVVGLGIGDSFLFAGYQLLGTRRAMLVQSTHPIFGTVLAVFFFGELPTVLQFLGIATVLAGLILVLGDGHHRRKVVDPAQRRKGLIFGLLAAMGQAAGAMLAKEALFEADAFGATQIRVLGGALSLIVFALVRRQLGAWIRGLLQPQVLWRVSAASVLGPFIAVFLMLYSIQNAKAGVALTLLATAPVWLLPLGAIFQSDRPSKQEVAGVLVAVAGIAVLLR
jgi:drug/metabolite transporter (DMT)-like permease